MLMMYWRQMECTQQCGESLLQKDMARHCVTVCSQRLLTCVCGQQHTAALAEDHRMSDCGAVLRYDFINILLQTDTVVLCRF
jgi:hypothetical protein